MKRINKSDESEIVKKSLSYPKDRKQIREILEKEQEYFCAYTECRVAAATAIDVEHFNPKLKNTENDSYENWFAVSSVWNNKKGTNNSISRWEKYQPILHPTASDLEERILYNEDEGTYYWKENDKEAENLICLLNLNEIKLVDARRKHIDLLKSFVSKKSELMDFLTNPECRKTLIEFRRAIETVFEISF